MLIPLWLFFPIAGLALVGCAALLFLLFAILSEQDDFDELPNT